MPKTLGDAKAKVIRDLGLTIRPLLRDSGFTEGSRDNYRPLRLCSYSQPQDLCDTYVVTTVYGFTATGVITNAAGGACEIAEFADLPIEDLFAIRRLLATAPLPQ